MTEAGATTILVAVAIMGTATIATKAARNARAAAHDRRVGLLHLRHGTRSGAAPVPIAAARVYATVHRYISIAGKRRCKVARCSAAPITDGARSGKGEHSRPLAARCTVGGTAPTSWLAGGAGEPSISSNVRERQLGKPGYGNPQSEIGRGDCRDRRAVAQLFHIVQSSLSIFQHSGRIVNVTQA